MRAAPKSQRPQKGHHGLFLGPIRYPRMADQIAASIRDTIANGTLSPGTHLLEVEIAQEMGVSRVPVREALMQLEQEGLVIRKPNRGTFVTELTEKMMREVCSLRGLLEGFAVRQAVKRLSEEDFAHLSALMKDMVSAANRRDFSRVLDCDYQFHAAIVRAAGHELLEETWRATDAKVRVYLSATNLMHTDLKTIVESHKATLEALQTRNPERASMAMSRHIESSLPPLVARLFSKPKEEVKRGGAGDR
jgi:DNA-binding GntR family transcriptional regulator